MDNKENDLNHALENNSTRAKENSSVLFGEKRTNKRSSSGSEEPSLESLVNDTMQNIKEGNLLGDVEKNTIQPNDILVEETINKYVDDVNNCYKRIEEDERVKLSSPPDANKIYVFDEEVSLEGLYEQIDEINSGILNGFDIGSVGEIETADLEDVYLTRELIEKTKSREFEEDVSQKENISKENVVALFSALKNAQFNSMKLKSKVYEFIHEEIYKIESRYLVEIERMKAEHQNQIHSIETECGNLIEEYKSAYRTQEKILMKKMSNLKMSQEKYKGHLQRKVKQHVEEWKNKAQEEIKNYIKTQNSKI